MMQELDYRQIFNQYLLENGKRGVFDFSDLEPETKGIFQGILSKAKYDTALIRSTRQVKEINKMPYVHIDFIDNPIVGASASIINNVFYIGINYGTVLILRDVFSRMLSCRGIFTEIGSEYEEITPEPLCKFYINYTEMETDFNVYDRSLLIRPKDKVRYNFSLYLLKNSIDFILMHELGHLLHGHVDYMSNCGAQNLIEEVEEIKDNPVPSLTQKVLEWDADCFAVLPGVWETMSEIEGVDYINDKLAKKLLNTDLLKYWGISIWTFFRIMHEAREKYLNTLPSSHPTAKQRQFGVIYLINLIIKKYGVTDEENLESKIFFSVCVYSDTALLTISRNWIRDIDLTKILFQSDLTEAEKFVEQFDKHWKTVVRPALLPFARIAPLPE